MVSVVLGSEVYLLKVTVCDSSIEFLAVTVKSLELSYLIMSLLYFSVEYNWWRCMYHAVVSFSAVLCLQASAIVAFSFMPLGTMHNETSLMMTGVRNSAELV